MEKLTVSEFRLDFCMVRHINDYYENTSPYCYSPHVSARFYCPQLKYLSLLLLLLLLLFTAIVLSPGDSGYFTCTQNIKLVTNKFNLGGLHEKHVVATWSLGNRLSICL